MPIWGKMKSKLKSFNIKYVIPACVYFTILTVVSYFLGEVISEENRNLIPNFHMILLFLLFGFAFNGANKVFINKKLSIASRVIIHYAICTAYLLIFMLSSPADISPSTSFTIFAVFTVIYFIIMGTILTVRSRINRRRNSKSEYKAIYDKTI